MGVVFRARQISLDRIVAVKMILSGQLASDLDVQRFRTEAEAAASLHHTGIVAVHEVGQHDGRHYFSMEYVEGQDLADLVKERGPLPVDEAIDYMTQAARGLQYAHDQNIVHRDVSPHNVLVTYSGDVKLVDFGVAKATEHAAATQAGVLKGKFAYMSPEQARGETINPR